GGSRYSLGLSVGFRPWVFSSFSCHVSALLYFLAFGGHVVGNTLEPLVSYRHCATCEAANRPSGGFFRANIFIHGEAGRSLGCAQESDGPRQGGDERICRSRKLAGAEHQQDRR